MKLSKYLVVASLALGAIGARAGWSIQAPGPTYVTAGESGSSVYIFTSDTTGTITGQSTSVFHNGVNEGVPGASQPITSYSAINLPAGFTANVPFDVTVDWTIGSNLPKNDVFAADFSIFTNPEGIEASTELFIDPPAAAPEPSQIMAGGFLMACGLVIFAGRRLLKNQAPEA